MLNDTNGLGAGPAGRDQGRGDGFTERVLAQAHGYVETRKADAVRAVSDLAGAIRDTGAGFGPAPHLRGLFDSAAEGVDEFADGLARRSLGEIRDEVDAAVRRHPALAFAAAALAGYALFQLVRAPGLRPIPRSRALVPAVATPDVRRPERRP
ncbi:MAG: hypothetical protein K2X71_13415 [Methylobacterium sp.]|uniref:hypothetical protein n=1 Tax=Methylobacterium sp. TaxID=409 RepID=UPI00258CD8EB|nr:hypothetical protein [Methylobacterium sp.]MBY0297012.1 hypothetical protein [Methylobacterium sp.]